LHLAGQTLGPGIAEVMLGNRPHQRLEDGVAEEVRANGLHELLAGEVTELSIPNGKCSRGWKIKEEECRGEPLAHSILIRSSHDISGYCTDTTENSR
jgi:hypothetical protein